MTNFIKKVFVASFLFMLFGCSMCPQNSQSLSDDSFWALSQKLSGYNVDVHKHDDSVTLLLPSSHFFTSGSSNFTENAYKALELILALTDYRRDSSLVTVTGYYGSDSKLDRALAVTRARKIVDYLWKAGIYTTFIYADGKNMNENKECTANCVLIEIKG